MGITQFSKLVSRYFPDGIKQNVPLSSFEGKRIAIDVSMLYYAYIAKAKDIVGKETNFVNENPNQEHINKVALRMLFMKLLTFLRHKIIPIIVFDGTPHPLKLDCKEKRENTKKEATKKYELLKSQIAMDPDELAEEKLRKAYKQINHIDPSFKKMCYQMVFSLGIPLINADDFPIISKDAEAVCACLSYNGLIDATFTEDSDYHAYGGRIAITEIVGDLCKVRDLKSMLDSQNMPFHCFQDLCILMGTDFNTKLRGNGPVANWQIIYKYGVIEHYLVGEGLELTQEAQCLNKYKEIREMFCCTQTPIKLDPFVLSISQLSSFGIQYLNEIGVAGYADLLFKLYRAL